MGERAKSTWYLLKGFISHKISLWSMQSIYLHSLHNSAFFTEELSVILHNQVHFHKYIVQIFVTTLHWFCNPFSLRAVTLLQNLQYFGKQKGYMALKFLLWSSGLQSKTFLQFASYGSLLHRCFPTEVYILILYIDTIKKPLL